MTEPHETEVLVGVREAHSGRTGLTRPPVWRESTNKLARLLADRGASLRETLSYRIGMPSGDLFPYCSRETSGAQVESKGDSRNATSSLP